MVTLRNFRTYPLSAGSARPKPKKGAPDTENPPCIGFTALRRGLRPWSQKMVSEGAEWGRGRSELAKGAPPPVHRRNRYNVANWLPFFFLQKAGWPWFGSVTVRGLRLEWFDWFRFFGRRFLWGKGFLDVSVQFPVLPFIVFFLEKKARKTIKKQGFLCLSIV